MLVKDINGKTYEWKPKHRPRKKTSILYANARQFLSRRFPTYFIMEEVTVKIDKKTLYFDFFIPLKRCVIEVNGEQHYSFSSLFHKNKMDFHRQTNNDSLKRDWCEINNITYIELPPQEKEWESII